MPPVDCNRPLTDAQHSAVSLQEQRHYQLCLPQVPFCVVRTAGARASKRAWRRSFSRRRHWPSCSRRSSSRRSVLSRSWWDPAGAGRCPTRRSTRTASVFDGQFVRDVHRVTGAAQPYAGETIDHWDPAAQRVRFTYYNSRGGVSTGTMTVDGDRLVFAEVHEGKGGTKTEMRSIWYPQGDGYVARTKARAGEQ